MSNVPPISITHSFNSDAAASNLVDAAQLDAQLGNLAASQNDLKAAVDRITDGNNDLAPSIVNLSNLAPEVIRAIASDRGWNVLADCVAATTVNITLSGTQTIDGVAVVAGNRVLVKDQTTQAQNGIYVVAAGAWVRATDCDETDEFTFAFVRVTGGNANSSTGWLQSSAVVSVGTTPVVWSIVETSQLVLATGTTQRRPLSERFAEVVNVKDFGAQGDGVTDDTAAIQAALDYAATFTGRGRGVFFPKGIYIVSTIYLPRRCGPIRGAGCINIDAETVHQTRIQQKAGSTADIIRVIPGFDPVGARYYWDGFISDLAIWGAAGATGGWGLSFRDASGNNATLQDSTVIRNVCTRRCFAGGIHIPGNALPLVIENCEFLWNNGPGIHFIGGGGAFHQAIRFSNISGDGNNGGLIKIDNLDVNGSVLIENVKSEMRINSEFGSAEHQQNPIVITNCPSTPMVIQGVTHISSVPDGPNFKKPGSVVLITDSNLPTIAWQGIATRVRGSDTGADPSVIQCTGLSIAIPRACVNGSLSNALRIERTVGPGYRVFGPTDTYLTITGESTGEQVAGNAPGRSWVDLNGALNDKCWVMVADAGQLFMRAINDDGTLGRQLMAWKRTQISLGTDGDTTNVSTRINGPAPTTVGAAGGASALPATPTGYLTVNINGTDRKIPFYAV